MGEARTRYLPRWLWGGGGVKIFLNKIQLELPWVPKINSSLPEFAMQKISHSSFRAKR